MMTAQQSLATLFYTIFCLQMFVFGVSFAYFAWKGIQPVKARSKVLLCAQYWGLQFFCMYNYFKLLDISGCAATFATGWIFPYVLVSAIFVRVLRLFIIFNVNRSRFNDEKPKFFSQPRLVTELYLFFMFAAILSFFIAYRIFTVTYEVYADGFAPSEACGSPVPYFGLSGLIAIVIGLIILGWKLRRVHDAYFIKSEFTLLLIVALVTLPVALTTSLISGVSYIVGAWVLLICCNVLVFVSFGIPCLLAFKNIRTTSVSSDSSLQSTSTSKDPIVTQELDIRQPSKEFTKARDLITDPVALKYVQKYIIHYQDTQSGDCLLVWTQFNDFLQSPDEFLTAKASLLYQKFIKKDAYRFLSYVTEEQRVKIGEMIEASMQENAPSVPRNIFDEVMEETENLLIQNVFKRFNNSVFYREYKEAVVLSSGLRVDKN